MYCPEGYWSFSETCRAVSGWSWDLIFAKKFPYLMDKVEDTGGWRAQRLVLNELVSVGYSDNLGEAEFAVQVAELWLLANYMDSYDVVLCSQTGQTMRCPPALCAHGDALDWWTWPIGNEKFGIGESYGYLKYHREGGFGISDAWARFCAIDYVSGRIRLKPNSAALFHHCSYGHGESEADMLRFIKDQVSPFVGWGVCWNPDSVPTTQGEIMSRLGFPEIDWETFLDNATGDKKQRQSSENVLKCVLEAYPEGKGEATWSEVQRRVGYSRRSIVRCLKQGGRWSEWAKGGQ